MQTRRTVLSAGILLSLAGRAMPALAQTPGASRGADFAAGMMKQNPVPALSLAVMRGGDLAFSHTVGTADIELGVAATTASKFRMGSGAKPVTATLAAIMAEEGLVDLDAPIARTMPELPAMHRSTTLRQLLTHRSGIRHYNDRDSDRFAPGGAIDSRPYMSNEEILAVFIDDPLVAPPGTRNSYSTFGYTLASLVLEYAAKAPFLTLLQQKIALPFRLDSLGPDAPRQVVAGRVKGYGPASAIRQLPPVTGAWGNSPVNNPAYKWAGGGLLMTSADFARFGAMHLAPGILSRRVLDTLFTVQVPDSAPPLGLGWRINRDAKGRLRWHHAGGQEGARAVIVVYPQQNLSIAFATNATGLPGDVLTPCEGLADIFA
jgi:CubicO group peptidase (beta-lactamase class C family)